MKKNGFTLVELLSVLVLIGLLLGIGVPGVMRISSKMKQRSLNTRIDQIEQAATLWGQDNKSLINASKAAFGRFSCSDGKCDTCTSRLIKTLIADDYLDGEMNTKEFKNPVNGKDFAKVYECTVVIYKKNNRIYALFDKTTCPKGFEN